MRARIALGILLVICGVGAAAAQDVAPASSGSERTASLARTLAESLNLTLIEHGTRIAFQSKTRRELDGPFWRDYRRSVHRPKAWEDRDNWLVNYIGHPIHGAGAGYLWLDHDAGAPPDISLDSKYWSSRSRALAFSAVYSLQFEIGPLSEASIGNVGMRPETTGWVDYVVTPVGAFGLIVAEDALDRFFVKWVEQHTSNRVWRASLRLIFNPGRTLANTAEGRLPWYRDGRPLSW